MKQCPVCNRKYANNKQKFCTQDGASLIDAQSVGTEQETVRIDSAQLDKEVTKVISTELPNTGGVFDPYKTVVSTPQQTPPPVTPPADPYKTIVSTPQQTPPPVTPSADPYKTIMSMPQQTPPPKPPPVTPLTASPSATPPATEAPSSEPSVTSPPPPAMPMSASLPTMTSAPAPPTLPPATSPVAAVEPPQAGAQAPPATSSVVDEAGQVTLPPPSAQASTAAAAAVVPPVQPKKKRSKLPLILGILLVLLFLGAGGAVAGYFFVIKPMLAKKHSAVLEPRRQPTPNIERTPDVGNTKIDTPKIQVPPYSPPDDAVKFVNSSAKLTGKLAEHFVDFTFYYPQNWYKDPAAGTVNSTNFAKVQRQLAPDAPQEIFAVGWYGSTGAKNTDEASYPRLVAERSAQFAKTYPEYQKVSEGPAKAGPYDAYEFHFTGVYRNTDRGDVKIWGRVMFVPPNEGTRGVTLLMLASSLASEVKSVNDVGEKGQMPMVLESFRFGK